MKDTLKILTETNSISGDEGSIRTVLKDMLKDHVDSMEEDALGNLIVKKGEGSPVYLLDAHMDEVGFMVRYIEDEGFIRFFPIGYHWSPNILNQRVTIQTKQGKVTGVIQCKPASLMDEEEVKKQLKWKDMFIDVGASSKEEVEKLGIKDGDSIIIQGTFEHLSGTKYMAKAFDNRVGTASLVKILKQIKEFKGTIYGVFSSQEEVGLKGARVAAAKIKPDYIITLEMGHGRPPMAKKWEMGTEVGDGPIITLVEYLGRGLIVNPKLLKVFKEKAEKHKIPLQIDTTSAAVPGVTNSAAMQITAEGFPTITLGVPTKYWHTPNQIIDIEDLENMTKLVMTVVEEGI
ncbi:MAG: M20/M25/M40 family metallo-hydrolase [Nanoarchaeota archaeon]|nr:M20/M25/M40 family metallo-hydrolase [Nanoarchaeota archaeon]